MTTFDIHEDDLSGPEVIGLLEQHLDEMHSHTPVESVHALDVERLREDGITFWSAWSHGRIAGCGALKEIDPIHAEIKSMRTTEEFRGRGVATAVLGHLIAVARARRYQRLSLETGSNPPFEAARRLYERHSFTYCGPFADYVEDPWSVFMTLDLSPTGGG